MRSKGPHGLRPLSDLSTDPDVSTVQTMDAGEIRLT